MGRKEKMVARATSRSSHPFFFVSFAAVLVLSLALLEAAATSRALLELTQTSSAGDICNPNEYAIYLRPLNKNKQKLKAPIAAVESQKNWGGLHVTLTSYRPSKNANVPDTEKHINSLAATIEKAYIAARDVNKQYKNDKWTLSKDAPLPLEGELLMIEKGHYSKTLDAITKVIAAELPYSNPKPLESLHVSIACTDG